MVPTLVALTLLQATPYRTGVPEAAPYRAGVTLPSTTGHSVPLESVDPAPPRLARTGVLIDAYDRGVESRWGPDDPFYTSTVRGGAAAAQSRQGPLDGGWTLAGNNGAPLYELQLVDAGEGVLEGAWREAKLDAPGARPSASGFIALIARDLEKVVLRFLEPGASVPTVVVITPLNDGAWHGELSRGSEPSTAVLMRRP